MILAECLTWVPHIWGELLIGMFFSRSKGPVRPHITDDIVIDILSRLPADCVVKCRRVCKKWRALISSSSFAELHLKRGANVAHPSIFVHRVDGSRAQEYIEMRFHICDADERGAYNFLRKRIITKVRTQWFHKIMVKFEPAVCSSCDGLLVFRATVAGQYYDRVCVLNPITKELVSIKAPFWISPPCGIYRDPLTREYKLLLTTTGDNVHFYYYTASLKSMVIKKLQYFSTWSSIFRYARIISMKGYLHWFVEHSGIIEDDCNYAIMVFNTETEDIRVLPHPGDKSIYCSDFILHRNMELFETRGNLWLFNVFRGEIHVWVLEDYDNWVWDMKYKVNLDWSTWRFPFVLDFLASMYDPAKVKILGINNGVEILICWNQRGMFWYNLEHNTVSKASIFEIDNIRSISPRRICSTAYTKSLVHLGPLISQETKINEKEETPHHQRTPLDVSQKLSFHLVRG